MNKFFFTPLFLAVFFVTSPFSAQAFSFNQIHSFGQNPYYSSGVTAPDYTSTTYGHNPVTGQSPYGYVAPEFSTYQDGCIAAANSAGYNDTSDVDCVFNIKNGVTTFGGGDLGSGSGGTAGPTGLPYYSANFFLFLTKGAVPVLYTVSNSPGSSVCSSENPPDPAFVAAGLAAPYDPTVIDCRIFYQAGPPKLPPTATLSANSTSVVQGNSSVLTYSCTNGETSASIDNGVGTLANPASGTVSVTPSSTTTYTLRCTNANGSATATAQVAVTAPAPQPPTGLSASCAADGKSVNLSWTPTPGATYYNPRMNGNPIASQCSSFGWQLWTDGTTCFPNPDTYASTTVTSFPINPGQTYSWWVHASNGSGSSAPTSGQNFSCQGVPPAPASMTATCNANGTQATLSWTAAPTATGYYPRYSAPLSAECTSSGWQLWTDGATCYPNPDSGLAGATSAVVNTTPGKTYSAYVFSGNSSGVNWNASASTNFTCTASPPDLTASSITPTTAGAGVPVTLNATITNSGTGSTNTGFTDLFQRASDASGTGATDIGTYTSGAIAASGSNVASLSYTFPNGATTWYVRACADKSSGADANGAISESNENNNCGAWTAVNLTAPPTPTNPSAVCAPSGTSVTLSWNASPGADNYYVRMQSPYTSTDGYTSTSIAYPVVPGQTYSWWVHSNIGAADYNGTHYSSPLNGGFTCPAPAPAPAPTCSLSANPASSVPTTLSWSSTNATSCTGGGTGFNTANATSGSASVSVAGPYSLTCSGSGGSCTANVVAGPSCPGTPTPTITASPTRVRAGQTSKITYGANGVASNCTVTGPGAPGTVSPSACTLPNNSFTTPGIQTQTTYSINCSGVIKQAVVNVLPKYQEF